MSRVASRRRPGSRVFFLDWTPAFAGVQGARVQEDPDRQSRRDCLPRDPHGEAHGHQDGRGLFRRRRARAARPHGRRGGAPRPAARVRILPQGRADHRRLQGDRRRGGAPGLRLPVASATSFAKALEKAGIAFIGPPPKAIAAMGDKIESKKLAQKAGVNVVPGYLGDIATTDEAVKIAQRHRLSGDDEGLGRRRRQGHAPRLVREGRARGLRSDQARGPQQLRRRPRLHREVHRAAAAHRDPGARRPARQHPLPRRARMLDPAPPPEGGRGSAVALRHARDAQGDGRAGGRAGAGGRILLARARSS